MSPRIIITGSIQCGKSTLVRSVLRDLPYKIAGYFSQKEWNLKKGIDEIWLFDYNSDLKSCFAYKMKTGKFKVHLNRFDTFLNQIVSSNKITNSQILCMDEIGFLEKGSIILKDFIQTFQSFKIPIILVVQKRVLPDFQIYFQIPPWKIYDLDLVDSNSTKNEITTLLKN